MKLALTKVKPCRRPTGLGWLLIATLFLGLTLSMASGIYGFLSPQQAPHKGIMVVEGWIHDAALDEAVRIYRQGGYSEIICTGVPIETGSYIQSFGSYAEMTAARLRKLGIPDGEILVATADYAKKDRTWLAAVALREAIISHNIQETDFHLITTGPHGRRSLLLFRRALGKDRNVGITCLEDAGYDARHWYTYSQGVRKVIDETIAYLYAKLVFHP